MTTEVKTIVNANIVLLAFELQEHIQQGWELDENNPGGHWGIAYEFNLIKNDRRAAEIAQRILDGAPPKLSRAESLAKAREAKAAKQVQESVQN